MSCGPLGLAKSKKKKRLRDIPQAKDGGLRRTFCHRVRPYRAVGGMRDGPGCEREEYDGQVDGGTHGNDRSVSVQGVVVQRKRGGGYGFE